MRCTDSSLNKLEFAYRHTRTLSSGVNFIETADISISTLINEFVELETSCSLLRLYTAYGYNASRNIQLLSFVFNTKFLIASHSHRGIPSCSISAAALLIKVRTNCTQESRTERSHVHVQTARSEIQFRARVRTSYARYFGALAWLTATAAS